ncbi:hypothetical protein [Nonomuraea sp. NPDC050783]|uniref:hypothetical protein n=1 Tax=Nonomuraea sp. NPDC050783 TaxID=3154634 RepID=UPI0034679FB4
MTGAGGAATPITDLTLRGILDSRGHPTMEADVWLGPARGRGSCAVAIAPGRLERRRRLRTGALGPLRDSETGRLLRGELVGVTHDQEDLDARLRALDDRHHVGADVTLAVSLAHARAAAALAGEPFHAWLAGRAGLTPGLPRLLVNAFSGGIHGTAAPDSFQQIMIIPRSGSALGDVRVALDTYAALERTMADGNGTAPISASSGFLPGGRDLAWQLDALGRARAGTASTLGVDVAAEHLRTERGYRFQGREHGSADFAALLLELVRAHGIEYVEDPFDPADVGAWQAFLPAARELGAAVVGDDLFASDAGRVRPGLADAVLLKPSQAGTVTATLAAARAARGLGLRLAVSHRSGETEDTAMCDLAVAVGAEWIKIGGPRRGDRIAKYNQLIRLTETLTPEGAACHVPSSSRI